LVGILGNPISKQKSGVMSHIGFDIAQSGFADEWKLTGGNTETTIGAIKLQK
jgi:hypothetical protein